MLVLGTLYNLRYIGLHEDFALCFTDNMRRSQYAHAFGKDRKFANMPLGGAGHDVVALKSYCDSWVNGCIESIF